MIDKVFLWCGSGYQLTTIDLDFPVLDGETALECAVIKALDNQYPIWWIDANDKQAFDETGYRSMMEADEFFEADT